MTTTRFDAYKRLAEARKELSDAEKDYRHQTLFHDGRTIKIGEDVCHFVVTERDSYSGQIIEAEIWYRGNSFTRISELEELFQDLQIFTEL